MNFLKFVLVLSFFFHPVAETKSESIQRRAALDIGSGKTKLLICDIDLLTNQTEIIYSDFAVLKLLEDVSQNPDGRLSAKIQNEAIQAIENLKETALAFQPDAFFGIATQALRLAPNGQQLVERIQEELAIPIQIITQNEEGILGFLTATHKANINQDRAIVWDSGNGSFQITWKMDNLYGFYQGSFGKVPMRNLLLRIQGKDLSQGLTPNPISPGEIDAAAQFVKEKISIVPAALKEKMRSPNAVVLKIGAHPLQSTVPFHNFNRALIEEKINLLANHTDEEIRELIAPSHLAESLEKAITHTLPNLILIREIMSLVDIPSVHYVGDQGGNAMGVILYPDFWNKLKF